MTRWNWAHRGVAPKRRYVSAFLLLATAAGSALGQQAVVPTDPTEPLRRFPITFLVRRPEFGAEKVSLLRVASLRPKDDVYFMVDDRLKGDWTLVEAFVEAGERVQVRSWNLWDKRWRDKPIEAGTLPDSDAVPLFFLTLNKHQERHVYDAVRHALETSSQLILSQTATFETIYTQQNRLLNFMTAYANLGPKYAPDPVSLKDRTDEINLDLGATYDPSAQTTSPGQLQHSLDATVGLLGAFRESPDNAAPAAALTQSQLPGVVSDWVGLVGDLMKVFIKPPHDVKLTFVPASAIEGNPGFSTETHTMELITQRVLETKDDSLPSLVFRPPFERKPTTKPINLAFAHPQILAEDHEVAIELGAESRELFQHPWAWDWEISDDGKQFSPIIGAHLMPGRGLVFPISKEWWGKDVDRKLTVQARIGFQAFQSKPIEIAKIRPQTWTLHGASTLDAASGDPSIAVHLDRTGVDQPFYRFASLVLKDSAGKVFSATGIKYETDLQGVFNLAGAASGIGELRVQQDGQIGQDPPVSIFIAPKHPIVSIFCGKGDRVLRVSGPEAHWVKSVRTDNLTVESVDDSDPGGRKFSLSGPLPAAIHSAAVTYHDPAKGLEWTVTEPISVGLPRPRVSASLVGVVPNIIPVGAGSDASWAVATLPSGWFRSRQPVRVQLSAEAPFAWTHDVTLDLGFGPSGDVQKVLTIPEGPIFALDELTPNAYLTLDLDHTLLRDTKRDSGLVWVRLTRSELASPWTLVTVQTAGGGQTPVRAVKVPVVLAVDASQTGTRITLSNCDQVLGVRFPGLAGSVAPQFIDAGASGLTATVDGPAGVTEFDVELRDASEGVIHIKVVHKP